jgi:hypothetical protein
MLLLLLLCACLWAGHVQLCHLPCQLLPAAAPLLAQVQLLLFTRAGWGLRLLDVQLQLLPL